MGSQRVGHDSLTKYSTQQRKIDKQEGGNHPLFSSSYNIQFHDHRKINSSYLKVILYETK